MNGRNRADILLGIDVSCQRVCPGRLMAELAVPSDDETASVLNSVIHGYGRGPALEMLDRAGIRGRGGGGFPTAHKWWLVSSLEAPEKFFVCNANFVPDGHAKESWFIRTNPHKVVEAAMLAAYCCGAQTALIALPESASAECAAIEQVIRSGYASGTLGENIFNSGWSLKLDLIKTPDAYIAGEETALLNFIEGKPLQPRGKPPLPTDAGLFGKPTAINNLETVLQSRYALKIGPDRYRSTGVSNAPGTMVFTLRGRIKNPGIYELPLGTPLRELIFHAGGGMSADTEFKAAFPGGIGSAVLTEKMLDISLDFDSVRDAGSDLGTGVVTVLSHDDCMVDVALALAKFFNDSSCGKCKPCKDGTARALAMLAKIEDLDRTSVDISVKSAPPSAHPQLTIINNLPRGTSYTDTVKGLEKISHLCEFFQYRGDCHFSTEAANALTSLLSAFRHEFNHHMQSGMCSLTSSGRSEECAAAKLS